MAKAGGGGGLGVVGGPNSGARRVTPRVVAAGAWLGASGGGGLRSRRSHSTPCQARLALSASTSRALGRWRFHGNGLDASLMATGVSRRWRAGGGRAELTSAASLGD